MLPDANEERLQTAFKVFDQRSQNTMPAGELGTLLRMLGVFPTLQDVAALTTQALSATAPSQSDATAAPDAAATDRVLDYAAVRGVVMPLLAAKAMPRASEHVLAKAFQTLDAEKQAFLTPAQLRSFLSSQGGEPLSNDEIDQLLKTAVNPKDGNFSYDDYIQQVASLRPPV